MILLTDYLTRIGCAFLTGALIGIERQYRHCNAGLRTNILVSIGAAAFTILSYSMSEGHGDPTRIAAQIVSGIGFLGGGLILKDGISIRGLNTAATIWCSAACGTLSGVGLYAEVLILVTCILTTHCILRPLCILIEKKTEVVCCYAMKVECQPNNVEKIRSIITNTLAFNPNIKLRSLFYKEQTDTTMIYCDMETQGEQKVMLNLLLSRLRSQTDVSYVGWENKGQPQEDF